MSRSFWKGNFVDRCLLRKIDNKCDIKYIYNRRSTITEEFALNFINKKVFIHTGKFFIPITITKEQIGHKFGEFVFTRKKEHLKKENKIKDKKKNKYDFN